MQIRNISKHVSTNKDMLHLNIKACNNDNNIHLNIKRAQVEGLEESQLTIRGAWIKAISPLVIFRQDRTRESYALWLETLSYVNWRS